MAEESVSFSIGPLYVHKREPWNEITIKSKGGTSARFDMFQKDFEQLEKILESVVPEEVWFGN